MNVDSWMEIAVSYWAGVDSRRLGGVRHWVLIERVARRGGGRGEFGNCREGLRREGAKERVRMTTISTDVYVVLLSFAIERRVGMHFGLSLAMTTTTCIFDSARLDSARGTDRRLLYSILSNPARHTRYVPCIRR